MKKFFKGMIKGLASGGLIFFLYLAIWNLPIIYIFGGSWAAQWFLLPLYIVAAALFISTVVLTPVALIKRFRHSIGTMLVVFSFFYGFIAWYLGFIMGYMYWGEWGPVAGILLFGVGVMPVGLLATYLDADPVNFVILFSLIVLFIDTRMLGRKLQKPSREKADLDNTSKELWNDLENWSRP